MTLALTMQPPPTAEELELKQRVAKSLASQGVLGKIKAQLRAAVFHVMHEREQDDELLATNSKLQEFKHDGALALAIVMDFLAFFQLDHSLAVLRAETNAEKKSAGQEVEYQQQLDKLCERLGLSEQHCKRDYGSKQHQHERPPLLIQILQQQPQQPSEFSETSKDRMSRDGRLGEDDTKYTQKQKQFTSDFDSPSRHRANEFGGKNVALGEKLNTERVPTIAPTATASNSSKCADERANESGSDEEEEHEAYKNVTNSGNMKDKLGASLAKQDEDDDEDDDEVASGSELSESITEEQSASLNYSQAYESASKDESADFNGENAKRGITAGGGANGFEASVRAAGIREEEEEEEEEEHGDSGDDKDGGDRKEDEKAEESDEAAASPPVPTTLSPSLPPMAASASSSNITSSRRETLLDDDEFDEELEAARLSSLDAKLKAMEAEDETGTLQQLKASLQMELQQDDEALKKTSSGAEGKSADGGDDDDDDAEEHDGYGSDFEEEEVTSEVSDDEVGSVSDLLSDNDESQSQGLSTPKQQEPRPQPQPEAVQMLHEDRPVEDENALNSYDYIEAVERDW